MGFFSGITKALTGGSDSTSSSKSGFAALPKELRSAFTDLGLQIGNYTNPSSSGVLDMLTPMGPTADENTAFSAIRGGFTPTAETLGADLSMLENPYNKYVIDEINRQSGGQYSLLNEALSQVGQLGSSNLLTGASELDNGRINTIGSFLQDQFNNNLNTAVNVLPGQRAADAQGLLTIGDFMRQLDTTTKAAPVTALQYGTQLMSPFLNTGSSTSSSSNVGGFLPAMSGFVKPR